MKEEFRREYDRIHAPEELKRQTKQLMHERLLSETAAEEIPVKNVKREASEAGTVRKRPNRKKAAVIGAMALMVAALGIVIYAFPNRNSFYVTQMSEDSYYAQVEVTDGMIYFAERGESMELTPNASKEEMGQDKTKEENETEENGDVVTKVGNDGSIRVKERAGSLPKAKEEEYSYVAGERLLVTVTAKEESVYTAYLERNGVLYTVTGEGVSQKQFLDYIYTKFLKK